MKKKNVIKLSVSLILMVSIVFGFISNSFAEVIGLSTNVTKGYVTLSVEKFTLGQGYIVEPITIPYSEGDTVAKLITEYLGEGNYKNTGSVENGFYLSYVRDNDTSDVNVPQYILDQCGEVESKSDADWLGEFDYTSMSGWMFCVDNKFPNFGAADYKVEDNDVIRWQFTVYGYGMDIGGGYSETPSGDGTFAGSYVAIADKDKLTKAIGDINADKNKETILANTDIKNAYDKAYEVLEKVDSSQDDVDKALSELQNALDKVKSDSNKTVEAIEPAVSVNDAISTTGNFLYTNTPNPTLGTSGGEWTVLSLARAGYPVDENYYENYYNNVVSKIQSCDGVLSTSKYTEYSRVILALTAIGKDVTDVGGYNLLNYLADFSKVKRQGINGPIFALIALDTKNYEIPVLSNVTDQTTRQKLIDYILSKEIKKGTDEAGGWALSGTNPDPDITAMALQALAKYKDDETVKPYIDRAVEKLSKIQKEDGGYSSWGTVNSESVAQVITALTALGIDPKTDARFVKDGNWLISNIMGFYVDGGGFKHIKTDSVNGMATDQAMYSLVAYSRFVDGKTSLYNMTDVNGAGDKIDIEGKVTISMPEKISGKAGTKFNVNLNVGSWPKGDFKLLDGVITIPSEVEITGITMNSANITGGMCDFGVEGNTLRVVYTNKTLDNIKLLNNEFPCEILTINAKLKEDVDEDKKLAFKVEDFQLKAGSEESDIAKWDTVDSEESTVIGKTVEATSRVLFNGDGIDLIPLNKQAVAVEFINIDGTPKIIFNDNTEMTYSKELSQKKGVATYVALVDTTIPLTDMNNVNKYLIESSLETSKMKFGDINDDDIVNAQDALNALSVWLRKSSAPEGTKIIKMNVNGDSRINTSDALGIMEYYVNGKEYSILSK